MKILPVIAVSVALALLAGCMPVSHEASTSYNELLLAKEGMHALKPGDPAPDFTAKLDDGKEFLLKAELAKSRVVLFFYPANDTPNSAKHLIALNKAQAGLAAAKVYVVAVNPGPSDEGKAFLEKYKVALPLLQDEDNSLAIKYGCSLPGYEYVQRTLVGINSDGTVAFFYRGMVVSPDAAGQILKLFTPKAAAPETAPQAAPPPAQPAGQPAAKPAAPGDAQPATPPSAKPSAPAPAAPPTK